MNPPEQVWQGWVFYAYYAEFVFETGPEGLELEG